MMPLQPNVSTTMEKAGVLIERLQEQYRDNADAATLRITAEMLLEELQLLQKQALFAGKNVAVIMPEYNRLHITEPLIAIPANPPVEEIVSVAPLTPAPEIQKEIPVTPQNPVFAPFMPTANPTMAEQQPLLNELPTFAYQQKEIFELNDVISTSYKEEMLNDKLKTEANELGNKLKDSPIRDLRKAIGINDRFLFINDLFRGDEDMYERSLKTINAFSILPEAEYWIQRELKVKLGWPETSEAVKVFDQLVRRRFS